MINQLEIDNFQQLFQNNTPLMDVRAPVEYSRGSFPGVLNVPLITDNERHLVGRSYKPVSYTHLTLPTTPYV